MQFPHENSLIAHQIHKHSNLCWIFQKEDFCIGWILGGIDCKAIWGMSVGINSLLSSISVFSADLKKNSNSTQFNKGFWSCNGEALEPIKPLQPVGQAAEFKFESKFEPLPVIWQSLLKANPKGNGRF